MKKIFEEGDRVYHRSYGWGNVEFIDDSLMGVKFDLGDKPIYFHEFNYKTLSFTDYSHAVSHDRNDIEETFEKGEIVLMRAKHGDKVWRAGYYDKKERNRHYVRYNKGGVSIYFDQVRKYDKGPI